METAIVTTKGQVVIPSNIRKKFGIKSGTRIQFVEDKGKLVIIPITEQTIDLNLGILRTDGNLMKSYLTEKKKERAK
ncbi:MAG: AbrB/MazE/SpoVT family DNA-binding domain-containing protein [Melioribacteraceae bacterium]|nr:AbrB/MazE/SpoVT family DNA-binding domain-containing protein [Melioribacteraceae bacterium]